MKRLILFCCSCVPFWVQAQTAQVQIAGTSYPVIFADTNLSSKVKQRIASDLTILFAPASSFRDARGGGADEVEEDVFRPSSLRTLFPDEAEKRAGIFLVDRDNEKSVRVDKAASSNYVHAFKLVDAHSNAVAKLGAFVTQVNDPGWLTKTAKERRDMFHAPFGMRRVSPCGAISAAQKKPLHP